MYRLFNTSRAAAPFLSFEVPRSASVLRAVYDATTIRDDDTLTAELTRRTSSSGSSSWILTVTGQLQRCPGLHMRRLSLQFGTEVTAQQWPGVVLCQRRVYCARNTDRSFSAAGPRVWNALPPELRHDISCGLLGAKWSRICLSRALNHGALWHIVFLRLRNILTYLLTYLPDASRRCLHREWHEFIKPNICRLRVYMLMPFLATRGLPSFILDT